MRLRRSAVERHESYFSKGNPPKRQRIAQFPRGVNLRLLRGVADGITHIAEAATINQVNNEFELMHAFEISDLGLVACFRKRVKSGFDQLTHTATKDGLLTKEIGLRLLGESGLQNAGAR